MPVSQSAQSVWRPIDGVEHPVEVVFISDDPELADLYRLKLEIDGYSVRLVTTEQATSDVLAMPPPDLVYLDLGSLNPASLALYRMLRARPGTQHLPMVLLSTGNAREGPAGLNLGLHDFFIESDAGRFGGFWNEYSGVMLATQ
jgi:two-component system, OmpR family, phosphate regulon response regulator PhoB